MSSPSVTPGSGRHAPRSIRIVASCKIATVIQGFLLANQSRSCARELIFILSPHYLHAISTPSPTKIVIVAFLLWEGNVIDSYRHGLAVGIAVQFAKEGV